MTYVRLKKCRRHALRLSPQQYNVIQLLLRGMSNASIGNILNISQSTLENHVIRIRQKLSLDIENKTTKTWLSEMLWNKIASLYDELGTVCPENGDCRAGDCIRQGVCDCSLSETLNPEILP